MSDTDFRVCDFGDNADGLWCSTTYQKISHAKMGASGVGLVEPISRVQFFEIVEVFNYIPENRTRENGWWWCCISEAHFHVCDFGVVLLFQNFLQISRM
jgi:hypothetical protein